MTDFYKKLKTVPRDLLNYFYADCSDQVNFDLFRKFKLDDNKIIDVNRFMLDVIVKDKSIENFIAFLKKEFKLTHKEAKFAALEFAGKRLLIMDEWLKGEIANFIKKEGGDLKIYQSFVEDFKIKYQEEINRKKAEAEVAKDKDEEEKNDFIPRPKKKEIKLEDILDLSSPEVTFSEISKIISTKLVGILKYSEPETRIILNYGIIILMLEDEKFRQKFLNIVVNSNEKITTDPIIINNEKVDPTIENWIKDFVIHVHVNIESGETISTIQKAKYYADSPNLKNLNAEERTLIDKLFDLYCNLVNFEINANRQAIEDIEIFPITPEEFEKIRKELEKPVSPEGAAVSHELNLQDLYLGNPAEREEIEKIMAQITEETRRETPKVAEKFHDFLLRRKRLEIIACLKILANIGSLDDLIARDSRFKELLDGYFKRNNLRDEQAAYKIDPFNVKYVKHFLRYVLLERLGLDENESARIAMQLGNIFRAQGLNELAKLAYYDMKEKVFKWM